MQLKILFLYFALTFVVLYSNEYNFSVITYLHTSKYI